VRARRDRLDPQAIPQRPLTHSLIQVTLAVVIVATVGVAVGQA
jgi:hypothetical protein